MSQSAHKQTHALTNEELEKQIERLTLLRKPVQLSDPFPVCPTQKLPQSKIDRMVDHLYSQSLAMRSASIANLEARIYKSDKFSHKPLSQAEVELSVRRLYNDAILKKKENLDRSREQYLFHYPRTEKKIPLKDIVTHMYSNRIEAKEKTALKLYEKYVSSSGHDTIRAESLVDE